MEQTVFLEQLGHGRAVAAHRSGDRDLITLGRLVELDGHIFHLEALVGHLEAGADQFRQIGVHIHRRQQQLLGVGVGVVVVEVPLCLLNAVHAAPDRCFAQGQVIDVLNAVEGQRIEQNQTFQLVLVLLPLLGIVKQVRDCVHTGPQHGHSAHHDQHRDQQAQRLSAAAAVQPRVFFRGHIIFHRVFVS